MPKQLRVKARTGTRVHLFREYIDENGGKWHVSLCGIRTAPVGIELVDTWAPVNCRKCADRE